jgi:hypothetical protein
MTTKKMTEKQFIAKFKRDGFELYKTDEIKKKLDELDKSVCDAQKKIIGQAEVITGLPKNQFTRTMLHEIKEIAQKGFHYQAFILLGVFIKHVRISYSGGSCEGIRLFELEIQRAIVHAGENYRPGDAIRFSDRDHMKKHKSGARILSIHETIEEVEVEMERQGILREDNFLSFQ